MLTLLPEGNRVKIAFSGTNEEAAGWSTGWICKPHSCLCPVSNPMASFSSYLSIFEVTLPHHHGNPEKLGWGWQKGECALPPAACQLSAKPKAGFTGCRQLVGGADGRGHLKPPAGKASRENGERSAW